jgi:glycerol-3-phosphate dehydrogenase
VLDHEREDGVPGLVSMLTVKYTTARGVAEQAVDLALRRLRRSAVPCRTHLSELLAARPLVGTLEERTRTAARDEMARTLADAVLRRLDLGTAGRPDAGALDTVAATLASELGWNEERLQREQRELEAAWHG